MSANAAIIELMGERAKLRIALLSLINTAPDPVGPRFTISLKRSTQNLQLSTSCRPITPSIGP
jgi:hypothetical protein